MKKGVSTLAAFLIAITLTFGMPLTAAACDKNGCGNDSDNMGVGSMDTGKYNLYLKMNVKMRDLIIKNNKFNVSLNTK